MSLLISSCSSNSALTGIKHSTIQFGKDIGFIEVNRIKKPDYYSTKQIKHEYEFGRFYEMEHLDCNKSNSRCE